MGGMKYMAKAFMNEIRPIEFTRETDKFITAFDAWGNKRRMAKVTSNERFFDTWEEARDYLIEREERTIVNLKRRLQVSRSELGKLKSMKKPDAVE